jgi:hypothetical protein
VSDYQTMGSISEGTDVYGSDGEKVGSIVAVRPNYLVVEKGFFFPTDYYIPVASVASVEEGRVHLAVTKDAALNQGWDAVPADYDSETVVTTTTTDASAATPPTTRRDGHGWRWGAPVARSATPSARRRLLGARWPAAASTRAVGPRAVDRPHRRAPGRRSRCRCGRSR